MTVERITPRLVRPPGPSRTVRALRVVAVCMGLTALAFRQDPGWMTPDTKIDLTIDPFGFLTRALQLWEPAGNFGQLQNQAYGYLWPMGPFYALGDTLGLPAWVIQRLWWALLLCVAFTGVVRLAGRLNLGTPGSRIIAGVAFALSVRTLTELGGISIEAWPGAVAPWVLVPLVGLRHGLPVRRQVALSALAVACAGGVNATAVIAVVPLAVLWLWTVNPVRRRIGALVGWGACVALATAWWTLPLLLLGRYAPPFLDFIETAAVTTEVTDLQTMLRGASHWQAYFTDIYGPVWPAGRRLGTEPLLVAASAVVAALGLAGLSRRGMPHRRFLITGVLLGLALVGFGHVALFDGGFAEFQRSLLDGPAVALRNVHKFDVIIRLPLALGLAHLLGVFARAGLRHRSPARALLARLRWVGVTVTAIVAILGVSAPALAGGLVARGTYISVPAYWRQAGAWLDQHLDKDRVLIIPGARFGDYRWGSTGDEVIQTMTRGRWGVRNVIPLAPPGTIRLLDSIETALATGTGSDGLADLLARSGVRYLLVRADSDYGKGGGVAPMIVRDALNRSPGLTSVAEFGPQVGTEGKLSDHALSGPVPALEIFRVDRATSPVVAYDTSAVTTVVGGPESLLPLAASGRLPTGPTVLAGDAPAGLRTGATVVTDGMRRREVNFGTARDNQSPTLTATQSLRGTGPAPDYLPAWASKWMTTAQYSGVSAVVASSSWADSQATMGSRPEHQPFAAVDGDPATSWRTVPGNPAVGQWLELRFTGPRTVSQVTVHFDFGAEALPTRITIDAGAERALVDSFAPMVTVKMPGNLATTKVRILINAAVPRPGGMGGVGISEVEIPGVEVERTLLVPQAPATDSPVGMLFTAAPATASCFFTATGPQCDPQRVRTSEDGTTIDRTASLAETGDYTRAVWARPRPGAALDQALSPSPLHQVSASSTASADPAASVWATIDGDINTAWYPTLADEHPWLRLNWPEARKITGIRLNLPDTVAASRPWGVQVVGDGGLREGVVDSNGVVNFAQPMTTDEITVFFLGDLAAYSRNPYLNTVERLPVAVSELVALPDEPRPLPDPDQVVKLPCGSGPTLNIDGAKWRTSLTATRRELRELREVPAAFCDKEDPGTITLATGDVHLRATASTLSTPVRVALDPVPERTSIDAADTGGSPIRIDRWGSAERRLDIAATGNERILAVRENSNPGWQATVNGQALQPIVVDGWQQGWVLPAGAGGAVVLSFAPERTFRNALLLGAGLLVLVVVIAVLPGRNRGATHKPAGRARRRFTGRLVPLLLGGLALIGFGGPIGGAMALGGVLLALVVRMLAERLPADDRRRLHRAARLLWLLPPAMFLLGHWLAEGVVFRHTAAAPQLVTLAALTGLWISACWPGRPTRPADIPAPVHDRPLHAIPAHRGE
ncbi:arabinofuranan 3-O-arabinosyltransferase [Allocatelliglobosispora scoriae]|uniref:Arabinofuranan 3-O-arabinosyltransferase n=1 Tax=Allocatelliglobosispora scoriae TaxID=643052 RepID=A0A841BQ52_9ACTN|nr:alpha-(1->3)-arabinofuranosyltransferase [Allocatelliglobosispora scoriae]MBB5869825.1 arabinofuranan 3-O-arabinosyltransferase [Allocatelliglobosispora scoriae]